MALRAKKPEPVTKRLKLFLFGSAGVGKTTAAVQFPHSYIIDCERGTDHYSELINKSDGQVFQSTECDEVIAELRSLSTEAHDFRTVVIDPITTMESDLVERAEKEFGAGDMRIWAKRDKTLRRMTNLLLELDMNVVITAHGKIEYGEKMAKLGTTHDGWKRLPYLVDLSIELERRGSRRVGIVRKTRIAAFEDGEVFDFSYAEIARRYGIETMEKKAEPVAPASDEDVATFNALVASVKLEEGTVEKWLSANKVDDVADLTQDAIRKCIEHMRKKIEKAGGAK